MQWVGLLIVKNEAYFTDTAPSTFAKKTAFLGMFTDGANQEKTEIY